MNQTNSFRRRSWTLGVALALWLAGASGMRADTIDDLRQALALDDVSNPSDIVMKYREENLKKKIAALKSIGEMRRALSLNDWRDGPDYAANNRIRDLDSRMRAQIGNRLTDSLKSHSKSEDPTRRAAVASLLAEMGVSVRALKPDDKRGFAAAHLDIVKALVADSNSGVQQEALRALGAINADAKLVASILEGVLRRPDPGPGAHRLAAEGLAQMARVAIHLQTTKDNRTGVSADAFDTLSQVVRASPSGFENSDVKVRILSLEAFQLASQLLTDSVREGYKKIEPRSFPPSNRVWSAIEEDLISDLYQEVQMDVKQLKPMVEALKTETPRLTPMLRDASAEVRLGALNSLNQIANGWLRLRRYVLTIPVIPKSARQAGRDRATMIAGLDPLEPSLKEQLDAVRPLLSEPDSRLRRAAATFLMLIDERALPMLPSLVAALADSDRAIRWIAARSLQNMPPEQIGSAVPNLAKLLSDPDLTIRMVAADTLKAMGPSARAALDALADATLKGDADGRVAVMSALTALGPNIAQAAVPKLIDVLGQTDAEPKVIAGAAETLGQIGAAAKNAIPALRRLINHDSPEVRLAVSEAILSILGAKE